MWENIIDYVPSLIALITAIFILLQVKEIKRATYTGAFKAIYEILQDEEKRKARGHVLNVLSKKEYKDWTDEDKKIAEKVCHNYDSAGIIVRNKMLPTKIVADSWGDSLRRCWSILHPLVRDYRTTRNSDEFWDDFEWLAKKAKKYQKSVK